MATYEQTHDADDIISELLEKKTYHKALHASGAKVQVLFHYDDGPLKVRGIQAYAYVKQTNIKERALGQLDATMVIDNGPWKRMGEKRRIALVDHELYHLVPQRDKTNNLVFDDLGRPKFKMRKHDVEVGWFIEVAQEHKMDSIEVFQATNLVLAHRQTLFEFALEGGDIEAVKNGTDVSTVTISTEGHDPVTITADAFQKLGKAMREK